MGELLDGMISCFVSSGCEGVTKFGDASCGVVEKDASRVSVIDLRRKMAGFGVNFGRHDKFLCFCGL